MSATRFQLFSEPSAFPVVFARDRMFCIILHDPDDASLVSGIHNHTKWISCDTSNDFVVMSYAGNPEGVKSGRDGIPSCLYAEEGFDYSIVVGYLMRQVARDAELPVFLFSDDILSGKFATVSVKRCDVFQDLAEIDRFMGESTGKVSISDERFGRFISRFGEPAIGDLGRPLSSVLADMHAIGLCGKDDELSPAAEEWARKREEELLASARRNPDDKDASILYNNYRRQHDKHSHKINHTVVEECAHHTVIRTAPQDPHAPIAGSVSSSPVLEKILRYALRGLVPWRESKTRTTRGGSKITRNNSTGSAKPKTQRTLPFATRYRIDVEQNPSIMKCHPTSRDDIEAYNDLLMPFIGKFNPTETEVKRRPNGSEREFTPLAHYLFDFMDREVNLSIVQQMRAELGIEMPEYFNRYKPDYNEAHIISGNRDLDLNRYRKNGETRKLEHMMFGEAFHAYRTMFGPSSPYFLGDDFMDQWQTLYRARNYSAHAQFGDGEDEEMSKFNYERFKVVHEAFSKIVINYLERMMKMKSDLLH